MSDLGRLVTLGETMALFRASRRGALATQSDFTLSTGGAESNVAVGAQRLGLSATWIGVVGGDPLGHRILRDLKAEGVIVHARIDPAAPTGVMVKEQLAPGRNRVTFLRRGSAGSRLCADDVHEGLIASADVLHVTGIPAALSASAAEAVRTAIRHARNHSVTVSFDVNHRASLWDRDPRGIYHELARSADVLFAGDEEAALLVGEGQAAELAVRLAALGPREVVVKRGADGALGYVDGVVVERPGRTITPVDTVGAGDAFVAAYLATRLTGGDLAQRLAAGVTAGAWACLSDGDWEGSPTVADLASFDTPDPVAR